MFIQLLYFKILYYLFMKNKSIKIGVIGAGWWATSHHIPTLKRRKEVILDSVCRIGKRELLDIKDRFGFHFATEDYKELLKRKCNPLIQFEDNQATLWGKKYEDIAIFFLLKYNKRYK